MNDAPSQSQDKYVLRLPDGMRDRIKAAAAGNNRSMNAEIVATLEEKYPLGFTREETVEMLRYSLSVGRIARDQGTPPDFNDLYHKPLVWIAANVLGEKSPREFLEALLDEPRPRTRFQAERFHEWQAAMLNRMLAKDRLNQER